jgi:hypothetical protein
LGYDDLTHTVTFTPINLLPTTGVFTVAASGISDAAGDVQQVPFQSKFYTGYMLFMPLIFNDEG